MSYSFETRVLAQDTSSNTSGGILEPLLAALSPFVPPLLVAASVVVLLIILATLNHHRLKRRAQVTVGERFELQAALLEAVKDASANRRTLVDIRPFWRIHSIKPAYRKAVVDPLVRSGDVTVSTNPSDVSVWPEWLSEWWNFAFYLPPTHVVLTDRTWERMVHKGITGQMIVIERVGVVNWQSMNAGGDIIGSPQTVSGRNANIRTGRTEKEGGSQGVLGENLRDLVAALREDARNVPDASDRAEVRALADKIEDESSMDSPDEDKVEGMLQRARRYVSKFGDLMRVTGDLLRAWNQLDPNSD